MIKSENGATTIAGTRSAVATDLSLIVSSMRTILTEHGITKEEAEEEILRYVKIGFMSDEEREEEVRRKIRNISAENPFAGAFCEMFYNMFGKFKETKDEK